MPLLNLDIWVQILGWLGSIQVVLAYFLVSTHRISSQAPVYQYLNLVGGLFLIVLTIYLKAYPSAFVNIIWVVIAVYSLWFKKKTSSSE